MRAYYGWLIVAITMVFFMLLVGCMSNAFGLFVLPVSQDLGLSRADVNTGYILTILGGALFAPFLGRLVDMFPVRRVMLVCAVLFAAGLFTVGLSHNVMLSAAMLLIPVSLGMGGVGQIGSMTIIARWFAVQRARAMAIAMMGMSLGTIVLTPLVGLSVEKLGWRETLMGLSVIMGVVFVIGIGLMREKPGPTDVEPGYDEAAEAAPAATREIGKPMKVMEILRLPLFIIPAVAAALALAAAQAIAISIVPMAQEQGISAPEAATLMSVVGAMSIAGKFVLVWVGDRVSRSISLAVMSAATALSSAMLAYADNYILLMISSAFLGLAVGSITPALMALLADAVGAASFGSATGIAMLMVSLFGSVAMRLAGELYDRTGGYGSMFAVFVATSLVSLLLLLWSLALEKRRKALVPGVAASA